eukprot:scaffold7488_cov444-Prasinococcus_capsulatus_cf.AAC.5
MSTQGESSLESEGAYPNPQSVRPILRECAPSGHLTMTEFVDEGSTVYDPEAPFIVQSIGQESGDAELESDPAIEGAPIASKT